MAFDDGDGDDNNGNKDDDDGDDDDDDDDGDDADDETMTVTMTMMMVATMTMMVMMAMMVATIMASDDGAGKRRPDEISPFPISMSWDHSQRYLKLNCALCDTTNYTRLRRCPSTHVNVAPPPRMVARRYECQIRILYVFRSRTDEIK